jgi:DNA-binding transcriptional MerR regulator
MYRPGEIQKRLDISASTLRMWSNTFSDYLSPAAQASTTENGGAAQRRFTDADVQVLTTIKSLLAGGMKFDRIAEELATKPWEATREATPEVTSEATSLVPNGQQHLPEMLVALSNLPAIQEESLSVLRELVAAQHAQQQRIDEQTAVARALVDELRNQHAAWREEREILREALTEAKKPWYKKLM